jgi:hypothetical protein
MADDLPQEGEPFLRVLALHFARYAGPGDVRADPRAEIERGAIIDVTLPEPLLHVGSKVVVTGKQVKMDK